MRILMLNNEFPPLGGGTGSVNQALLRRWAHVAGLEIDMITSAPGTAREQARLSDNITLTRLAIRPANIHHASNGELIRYARKALAVAAARHRQRPYDFCFAWSALPAGAVALGLRKLFGLPYLVRVCGPDIPGFEQRYGRIYGALTPLIRATWRNANAVVAKCQAEAEMIRAVDNSVDVTLIANGVDLETFAPAADDNAARTRILCVARLIERKGQRYLLEALATLIERGRDVELELVGTGDDEEALRSLAARLGIAGQVHFAGYVPRSEMPARYAAAHVFALPSYNEGMSVATLEAMGAGLPLVVTPTGGTAELIVDGKNGLFCPWADAAALARQLDRLCLDRELAGAMGRASRARAEQFSWEQAAARYVALFDGLGQAHTTRPGKAARGYARAR